MKKIGFLLAGSASFLALPLLVFADAATDKAVEFVDKLNSVILFPTIALLSAVAFLVFLWGVAQYFFNATSDQGREQGVKHITWGIIGLVIMLSAFTLLKIAASTFDLTDEVNCASDPKGCGKDPFKLPEKSANQVNPAPQGANQVNPAPQGANQGNPVPENNESQGQNITPDPQTHRN